MGADIIDLGMGNPDLPTPKHIVDKLKETVREAAHRPLFGSSQGHSGPAPRPGRYYERRFGVKLNPDTQVVATLGSKEGFANMAQAITAPGDVVLVPEPDLSDPRLRLHHGGRRDPLGAGRADEEFFRALERAMRHSIPKPIALILNYPSNPTAYVATLDFYKDVVAFAKKHDIFILSDLAYSEIYFDGNPPPSVLQVPGAMDVAVEFTSMSKTFSMAGWRMGFAVGNERLIAALARVKSYLDYGAFTPIQVAATAALNGPTTASRRCARSTSAPRRDGRELRRAGWDIPAPARPRCSPGRRSRSRSARTSRLAEFSKLLIEKADVAVAPGVGFGEHGDDYVRIALVENEQRIRQAARNIKKFVELIGGEDGPALAAIKAALDIGRPVVTANKALLAKHGVNLARLAEKNRAPSSASRRRWPAASR
jgi:alanine-synthesizing transaminase